jgi:glycosyltransferase involved in cell wall biosynthesis
VHRAERIALIVSVLNEGPSIDTLLDSVAQQRHAPDEIVIVDGGSVDDTRARLAAWQTRLPLNVVYAPGSNISQARNLAIRSANAEVIAVTDAGVRLDPDWLLCLRARLTLDVDVVSGFFRADAQTTFERAMGATVLPTLEDVRPEGFLPSSRSVLFRRAAWAEAGGYPEWLDYGEDLVFDLALRRAGRRFAFASDAVVWFRPRGSLRAFFRQYFLYARGDGKADLWRRRHAIRYAAYALGIWSARGGRCQQVLMVLLGLAYVRRPIERLFASSARDNALGAVILIPVIRVVGDLAKMCGYPVGLWWRIR